MLLSVTSGKGGVGKTSVVINLAAVLAGRGRRVLVADCDLGLANADILLGLTPQKTLYDVLREETDIKTVLLDSGAGFDLLPASSGVSEMVDLGPDDHRRLLSQIVSLFNQYDLVLLDTGAGISSTVIRFNHMAHEIIILLTPEPTSVTDAYALIKVLRSRLRRETFHLLVNMVKNKKQGLSVSHNLAAVTRSFLKVNSTYLGHIVEDISVSRAVRKRKPCVKVFPESPAAACLETLAQKIITWTPKGERDYSGLLGRPRIQ